jgi:xanthine dehydrogenase accessory factor
VLAGMADSDRKAQATSVANEIEQLLNAGRTGVLITIIDRAVEVGSKLLVDETGRVTGAFRDDYLTRTVINFTPFFLASRDEIRAYHLSEIVPNLQDSPDARLLFERIQPEARLVICGAGHVGAALAKFGAASGFQVALIDDRDQFLLRERFTASNIELIKAENWVDAVRRTISDGAGVSLAIVTRGHSEDEQCLRAAIDSPLDYVGMIGSKRRTNIVLQRLRNDGIDEEKLRRVRAPVGLDIGAITPEEVAVSILSEIIMERRGGKGGSLSTWRRT